MNFQIHINTKQLSRVNANLFITAPNNASPEMNACIYEYNEMMKGRCSGTESYIQEKYITITVTADSYELARGRLEQIDSEVLGLLRKIGCATKMLNKLHRLALLLEIYRPDDTSELSYSKMARTGICEKDIIAPYSIDTSNDNYIKLGDYYITSGLSTSADSADATSSTNYTGSDSASTGKFIWPLPGHTRISSGYGVRVDPITGKSGAFHTGIDIPAPTGTLILASASGTVSFAGVRGGYGNCVIINLGNGLQTLYGHSSALLVKKGDTVTQGQAIAKVGQTGRATGPHLHFEVRVNNVHTDPTPYLKGASKK